MEKIKRLKNFNALKIQCLNILIIMKIYMKHLNYLFKKMLIIHNLKMNNHLIIHYLIIYNNNYNKINKSLIDIVIFMIMINQNKLKVWHKWKK